MRDDKATPESEQDRLEQRSYGAPAGARQNVRSETGMGAAARPGGATQNSGGALETNQLGHGPGRGAD